jgi:hypothetical protein
MCEVKNKAFGSVYVAACALLAIGEENNNHYNNNKYDRREKKWILVWLSRSVIERKKAGLEQPFTNHHIVQNGLDIYIKVETRPLVLPNNK